MGNMGNIRGYIIAALLGVMVGVIGVIGVGAASVWRWKQHTDSITSTSSTQTVNVSEKQIKTDTITEKRVLPDGTKVQRSVTSTVSNEQQNGRIKENRSKSEPIRPKNEPISKSKGSWSLGLSFTPKDGDWMDMRSYTRHGVSSVEVGRRVGSLPLWGSPALWGEIGYSLRDGQFTLGVRIEM